MQEEWMKNFKMMYVDAVLEGRVAWLDYCFTWRKTPEGEEFWNKLFRKNTLTPQAHAIIWKMKKRYLEEHPNA